MRAVKLQSVKAGSILGKSIFNERSELMLAAGYELNFDMLQLLKKKGFRQIYIVEELDEGIKPLDVISETVRQTVTKRLSSAFGSIEDSLSDLPNSPIQLKKRLSEDPNLKKIVPMEEVNTSVNSLLEEILDKNLTIFGALPVKSELGKAYQHAIDTATLTILMGQYFNYDSNELKTIGTAAMLHDIGKMAFGSHLFKPIYQLTFQEKWLLREHPTYSMLILKGSDPHSYMEQTTVLQHHERPDGKGYPQGMRGLNTAPMRARTNEPGYIFRHAEILAVANAYDNLMSGDTEDYVHSPQSAISTLVRMAGTAYNPHVLRALTKVVQFYPAGCQVRILNTYSGDYVGFRGIVKEANPVEYSKPLLLLTHDDEDHSIEPEEIDLRLERAVYLELVL